MSKPSPLLRMALAGASITVSANASAAEAGASVFTGVRVSYSKGQGVGVGTVVRPAMSVLPYASQAGLHVGVPFVWTHSFGKRKSNSFDLMGQLGGTVSLEACVASGLDWYIPLVAGSAQGGVRWTQGETHRVVGGNLTGVGVVDLDYTADLDNKKQNRVALGLGVPIPVASCGSTDGRPLRGADGQPCGAEVAVAGPEPVSAEVRHWLQRASDELGAVRSFVELSAHLRAHDAPTSLVNRAEQAAEEELQHAQMCLAMATRILGRPVRGRVPAHTGRPLPELARIAAESHLDGWQNEGLAAAAAADRADRTADPVREAVETRIAAEETDHAHYGRQIDRWARWRGGQALEHRRREVLESHAS